MSGFALFEDVVHSSIDPQTLKVLGIATNSSRQQRKNLFRSNFILSRSLGFDHDVMSGLEHDPILLCVRILVPNARSLSDSISRNQILDICAPECLPEKTDSWSPREFYENVHVPKSDGIAPDVPSIDQLQCELYPFQKRAVQWLLWREGAVPAYEPPEEFPGLPHGFVRTSMLCFLLKFFLSLPNFES